MVGEKPRLSFAREGSEGNPIYGSGDHPSAWVSWKSKRPNQEWPAASKIRKNVRRRKEKKKVVRLIVIV